MRDATYICRAEFIFRRFQHVLFVNVRIYVVFLVSSEAVRHNLQKMRSISADFHWAHGVVVSHPLRMRKALGSNPSVSIF